MTKLGHVIYDCVSHTRDVRKPFRVNLRTCLVSPKGMCSCDGKSLVKEIVYLLCFFNDNFSLPQFPHNFMLILYKVRSYCDFISRYIEINHEIYMDIFKILLFEIIEEFVSKIILANFFFRNIYIKNFL